MSPRDQIVDLRLDFARQRGLPVFSIRSEGHDIYDLYFAVVPGLPAADHDLDLSALVGNRSKPLYLGVLAARQVELVGEGRVEAGIGEALNVIEGHSLPEQPGADGTVAAFCLVPQQSQYPNP